MNWTVDELARADATLAERALGRKPTQATKPLSDRARAFLDADEREKLHRNSVKRKRADGYDSKLEAEYAAKLDLEQKAGVIYAWGYHQYKLNIGTGAWYTPDFHVLCNSEDGIGEAVIDFIETKGFSREAARVRIKCAAKQFPQHRFFVLTKPGKEWLVEEI